MHAASSKECGCGRRRGLSFSLIDLTVFDGHSWLITESSIIAHTGRLYKQDPLLPARWGAGNKFRNAAGKGGH